jgi:DNA-binding NarL/FixJ family response regulator
VRVVIAEDGVLLREGLGQLLAARGFEVAGSCDTADRLLLLVRSYSPDVAIVDIRLPPTHSDEGLRAALEIRSRYPSAGVLVLSQYVELGLAMKLLADSAEGAGYLLKNRVSNVKDFLAAVERVGSGGSAIDPGIISTLVSKRRSGDPLAVLTPREREILVPMAEGRSNQGIADALVITLRARRTARLHDLRQAGHPLDRDRVAPGSGGAALPWLPTPGTTGREKTGPRKTSFPASGAPPPLPA